MTTHRMTIDVTAYRTAPDGSLPEEALTLLEARNTGIRRVQYERSEREVAMMREVGWELEPHADYWYWFDCNANQRIGAGGWVVCHEYGCEAISDEAFRACCEEVEGEQ